jgi:hypothetical protein
MSLYQKLKIKPKQQNQVNFDFNLKKGAVKTRGPKKDGETKGDESKDDKSKIHSSPKNITQQKGFFIDKTDEGFDRAQFMILLKKNRKVKAITKPTKPKSIVIASPTRTVFKFVKKTNRRIRLKSKDKKPPRKVKKRTGVRKQREEPIPEGMVSITEFEDRLHEKTKPIKLRYSTFYLNNREIFLNFINSYYSKYKAELTSQDISCEDISKSKKIGEFSLLTHQKIVRDYINLKTPYRGLLLYHGLGAGKTCGSIAIAEGLKSKKKIIIMAPASLVPNYIGELKFCGDPIYKLKQYWEFIPTEGDKNKENQFAQILSVTPSFIHKAKGAWLVDKRKQGSNYSELSSNQKLSLNKQINKMIENKYQFIPYNGYRMSHLESDSDNFTKNPFDNKVIIIDEAHNLVSRIVNKIKKKESLSYKLYDYLMSAQNCKIVLLTGTPIINYPNEIGILFNILRGYIKTFKISLNVKTSTTVNLQKIKKMLKHLGLADYIDYSSQKKLLTVTRNPFGYVSSFKGAEYKGVQMDESGNISDDEFLEKIRRTLYSPRGEEHDFIVFNEDNVEVNYFKALPDTFDDFNALFKNSDNTVKNSELFKRRIVGLTSYFRSAQESLMPTFDPWKNLHITEVDMSDHQLGVYQLARDTERNQAKNNAKKMKRAKQNPDGLYDQTTSTYRIFSRAFCNFAFPNVIERPLPNKKMNLKKNIKSVEVDESDFDALSAKQIVNRTDGVHDVDDLEELKEKRKSSSTEGYNERIQSALDELRSRSDEFLSVDNLGQYSPKFLEVYNNIVEKDGLHLVYSQFKTLEGIGIFKLVLEANGFAELKLKKTGGMYRLDIAEGDKGKPMFAAYTGDEDVDEKEILRWIFNSEWDKIPQNIKTGLEKISSNNHYGEIAKVFMITASGAEGITLKNTRHVHIMEPYWHPVRVEQVIGRARRICSHEALKEDEKTVDVYIYLATFSKEQMATDGKINQELKVNDLSQLDGKTVMTTDQYLWEISQIKENINKNILMEVKESSIDCQIHNKADNSEKLKCYSFGKTSSQNYAHVPNIDNEPTDSVQKMNKRDTIWEGKKVKIRSTVYIAKKQKRSDGTYEIYDYESFKYVQKYGVGNTIFVGIYDPKTKRLMED